MTNGNYKVTICVPNFEIRDLSLSSLEAPSCFTSITTENFSNETALIICKGCLKEIMNIFSGLSTTSGQAPIASVKSDVVEYIRK